MHQTKMALKLLIAFLFLINQSKSECPQDTFNYTSARVCARKCVVQKIYRCIEPEAFLGDITSVDIYDKVQVFRRGAIQNMPELREISMLSTHLTKLNVGCFLNLPKLQSVKFVFNDLEEILWGVFNNSTIEQIDLSWGLVSSIENEAFSNMPNLRSFVMTRNKIETFDKLWFRNSNNLELLSLGYNKITRIWTRSFDTFPRLKRLDLSFNQIKNLDATILYNVENLLFFDLTSNELSWIKPDLGFNTTITQLHVALNKLSFLPVDLLKNSKVKRILLHPNPWQCPCLDEVTKWIYENSATVIPPYDDHRIKYDGNSPECYVSSAKECVVGYDTAFLEGQKAFFKEVNYSSYLWERSTTARPNFDVLQVDPSIPDNLSQF